MISIGFYTTGDSALRKLGTRGELVDLSITFIYTDPLYLVPTRSSVDDASTRFLTKRSRILLDLSMKRGQDEALALARRS